MSDAIANIFIILSIIAGVIFAYILMKDKGMIGGGGGGGYKGNAKNQDEDKPQSLVDKSKLQDLFDIASIGDDNIIHMISGNGMRVIFTISTPDIYLLNEDEQHAFENSLLQVALSLEFPIQFFTATRKIETTKPSERLKVTINSTDSFVSDNLRQYARMLSMQLEGIEQNRKINEIKNYFILGVNNIFDDKRARNQLEARIETVVKGFTQSKIKIELLERDKVLQLLSDILNKGDNISVKNLRENDAFGMYSTGNVNLRGGDHRG